MNNKKVAVVTLCWNRAKYLPRFLSALQKLELDNLEIVWFFAYGPSGDGTLELLQKAELPFKMHIATKKDVGETNDDAYTSGAEAHNYAWEFTRKTYGDGYFDFISHVDIDIIVPANFFTRLLPYFDNPKYAAVFGWVPVQNKFLKRIDRLKVKAGPEGTWESPICGGGATIYRGKLYSYHDTRLIKRYDTDFILSITRDGRDYYKTLYVDFGMVHVHEMSIGESLTTYAFKRGFYQALLSLKHRDYYGNPYFNRGNILYFGIILDFPLCLLFLTGILPWWLGIWSLLGIAAAISYSLVKQRKGLVFSTYEAARELATHFGLLCGLVRFGGMKSG